MSGLWECQHHCYTATILHQLYYTTTTTIMVLPPPLMCSYYENITTMVPLLLLLWGYIPPYYDTNAPGAAVATILLLFVHNQHLCYHSYCNALMPLLLLWCFFFHSNVCLFMSWASDLSLFLCRIFMQNFCTIVLYKHFLQIYCTAQPAYWIKH